MKVLHIVRFKTLDSLFNSLLLHEFIQRGLTLISGGKCGSPLIKVTHTESISNLRHAFTINKRITSSYVDRSSHTK